MSERVSKPNEYTGVCVYMSAQVSEWANKYTTWVPGWTSQWANEWVIEWANEYVNEWVHGWGSELVSERASEPISEWVNSVCESVIACSGSPSPPCRSIIEEIICLSEHEIPFGDDWKCQTLLPDTDHNSEINPQHDNCWCKDQHN